MLDWKQYWLNYEDLRLAGLDSQNALEAHYIRHGKLENRTDKELVYFDHFEYRLKYPDLWEMKTRDELLDHYFHFGYFEKRTWKDSPRVMDYFKYYLENCPSSLDKCEDIIHHLYENPQPTSEWKDKTSILSQKLSVSEILKKENFINYCMEGETHFLNLEGNEIPIERKNENENNINLFVKKLFFKKKNGDKERSIILLQIGLGDLLNFVKIYKNSALLQKNIKLIVISRAYLEFKNENYFSFVQDILNMFGIHLPIKIVDFDKYYLIYPSYFITNFTNLFIHNMMEAPMDIFNTEEDFIIINTKSRFIGTKKEEIFNLFYTNIQSIIDYALVQKLKIYVMGERDLGYTLEEIYAGFTLLYDKILPFMKENPDLWVDKTTDRIINNQGNDLTNLEKDLEIFKKAKMSLCFGYGGAFVISCLFCKKVVQFYNPTLPTHDSTYHFLNCFKNKNLILSSSFVPPEPTFSLNPVIKEKKVLFLNWHSTAGRETNLLLERLGCQVDLQLILENYEVNDTGTSLHIDIYDPHLTVAQIQNYFNNFLSGFDLIIIPNLALNPKLLEFIFHQGTFKILILWWGTDTTDCSHLDEYKTSYFKIPQRSTIWESFSLPFFQKLDYSISLITPIPLHRSILQMYNSYCPVEDKIMCVTSKLFYKTLWDPIFTQITQEQIQGIYFMGKKSHPDDFSGYGLSVDKSSCEFNVNDIICMYKKMAECRFFIYLLPFQNMIQYSVLEAIYIGIPVFYLESSLLSSLIEDEDLGRCKSYSEMFEKIQRCKKMDTLDYLYLFRQQKTCLKYFREDYIQQEWIKSLNIIFQE